MQILSLTSQHNQKFQTVLSVDGKNINLQFQVRWNEIAECWIMKITDSKTQEVLIDSFPLLTADDPAGNLLEQMSYLEIGSAFLVNVGNVSSDPAIDDLGSNFILFWHDTL